MADTKRLRTIRFEVGRALRTAQTVSTGDLGDTTSAIRELGRALSSLAMAVDDLLEEREPAEVARAG